MKYNKLIIGIDQSYTRTGITIAGDGHILKVGYISFDDCELKCDKREKVKRILSNVIKANVGKATQMIVIVERIRQFRGNVVSMDYIKSTGALIGTIIDTAHSYGIKTYSADTRSWKSQVIGTSKPLANSYNIDPNKWPTIKYMLNRKDIKKEWLCTIVSNRCKKYSFMGDDGKKYMYNDDAADSAGLALYGFSKDRKLNPET